MDGIGCKHGSSSMGWQKADIAEHQFRSLLCCTARPALPFKPVPTVGLHLQPAISQSPLAPI
jgi:hypothetical protein